MADDEQQPVTRKDLEALAEQAREFLTRIERLLQPPERPDYKPGDFA